MSPAERTLADEFNAGGYETIYVGPYEESVGIPPIVCDPRRPERSGAAVAEPAWQEEAARHHRWLRERLAATADHFVLSPAFGCEGMNLWVAAKDKGPKGPKGPKEH